MLHPDRLDLLQSIDLSAATEALSHFDLKKQLYTKKETIIYNSIYNLNKNFDLFAGCCWLNERSCAIVGKAMEKQQASDHCK